MQLPKITLPWKNPVFVKELRTRMRGNRTFVLVTAHLLIVSAIALLAYLAFIASLSSYSTAEARRNFGKLLFGLVVLLELFTITFIAPALTSGMISSERERQTYDLIKVTLLPARSLVSGKYAAALVFLFLLLFTSIPLQSPAFLVGGASPSEIIIAVLIIAVTAVVFCAAGIFFSSLSSRTLLATILSYAFAIILVFGIPALLLVFLLLLQTTNFAGLDGLSINAQFRLLLIGWWIVSTSPLMTVVATELALEQSHGVWWFSVPLSNGVEVHFPSPWSAYVIFYLILSVVFIWLSVRRIRRIDP
ncbi:MAG: hypothetical protein AB1894_20515 [Chloroflexota bacterium]